MQVLTRALAEVGLADVASVGGKAARLGEMLRGGLPVPAGFVVVAEASHALTAAAADVALAERHARALTVALPQPVADAVLNAYDTLLPGQRVAVRSSAIDEDGATRSFAGLHATYYDATRETLVPLVRDCMASQFAASALAYRAAADAPADATLASAPRPAMAVIVQTMVDADAAGVAFTRDPNAVAGDDLIVEVVPGLGAALVDGRVTADHYRLRRDTRAVRDRRLANSQLHQGVAGEAAAPGPASLPASTQATLDDATLVSVASLALACERLFAAPQDVEFAVRDGVISLLQSRPITGLVAVPPAIDGRWVIFKPLIENFTEPMAHAMADLMSGVLPPFVRVIDGRVYSSLDALHGVLPLRDEQTLAHLALMRDTEAAPLRWAAVPQALLLVVAYLLGAGAFLSRTRWLPADFMERFRARVERVSADPDVDARGALRTLFVEIGWLQPVGNLPMHVNLTAGRYFVLLGVLRALLQRWLPDLEPDAADILCTGTDGMRSAEMGRAIEALAVRARSSADLRTALTSSSPRDALSALPATADVQAFRAALTQFLAVNGHRAAREFDVMAPRWHEDPSPVLAMVRVLLDGTGAHGNEVLAARRQRLRDEIRPALGGGLHWWLVDYLASRVRYFARLRENSRHFHIMVIDVVRKKLLVQARALIAQQRLASEDDVFFLTPSEAQALATGALAVDVARRVLATRRLAHARRCREPVREVIGFDLAPIAHGALPTVPAGATLLRGFAAAPGIVEGIARVLFTPDDGSLQAGEILVAPYTDPGWTPLFLHAAGAVVEVGSYLSHAGTLAREFGMPCVVDVAGATKRIRTGDRLRLDASTGCVFILGAASP